VVCAVCCIPHHRECWQENGGCTTFGDQGLSREAEAGLAVRELLDVNLDDQAVRQSRQKIIEKPGRLLAGLLGVLAILWLGFFSFTQYLALQSMRLELKQIEEQISNIEQENRILWVKLDQVYEENEKLREENFLLRSTF